MRGKVVLTPLDKLYERITPAYAGKSPPCSCPPESYRDHPRLCGEKHRKTILERVKSRITPAYAGKRPRHTVQRGSLWDHPRLCGEKLFICNFKGKLLGSPPPMRGKAAACKRIASRGGITPAYAGKRSRYQRAAHLGRDHPRLCGEKLNSAFAVLIVLGSPPPMRGKVCEGGLDLIHKGITPAYAGKRYIWH